MLFSLRWKTEEEHEVVKVLRESGSSLECVKEWLERSISRCTLCYQDQWGKVMGGKVWFNIWKMFSTIRA